MNEARARRELVRYSRQMHAAGWVANHDGNLSVKVAAERIVCTPTSFSKLDVGIEDLVVIDADGKKKAGAQRPFSERVLHTAVYAARPTVAAVVHAHPPYATAYGAAGRAVPHPFLPEAVVSLGPEIPLVPLSAPGGPAVEALRPCLKRCDAVLIAGNGALAWGPDLETAYLRLELVEHLAKVAWTAEPLGGVKRLPADVVDPLLAKRRAGGLAAPEEGAAPVDTIERAVQKALAGVPGADRTRAEALARQLAARARS